MCELMPTLIVLRVCNIQVYMYLQVYNYHFILVLNGEDQDAAALEVRSPTCYVCIPARQSFT